jgi:hypothetical protein
MVIRVSRDFRSSNYFNSLQLISDYQSLDKAWRRGIDSDNLVRIPLCNLKRFGINIQYCLGNPSKAFS